MSPQSAKNQPPLHIGYLLQSSNMDLDKPSGPQVHVTRIVQGLRDRRHHVRVVQLASGGIRWSDNWDQWKFVPFNMNRRPLLRLLAEKPVRLLQTLFPFLPYFNYFNSLRFADTAYPILADMDLLYERYVFMAFGGTLLSKQLQAPILLEVNGYPFTEMASYGKKISSLQRKVSFGLARWTFANVTKALPSGKGWQKLLIESGILKQSHSQVVWPGVDVQAFNHDLNKATVRQAYGLVGDPIIVFSGGFHPWQGLSGLIQAFANLLNSVPDALLLLIGEGPQRDELEIQIQQLGCAHRVSFLGYQDHKPLAELVSSADIGVLLIEKHAEFVGMKLFDYMASGLAIIVTAPEQQHDLIINNHTGLVIEPGNSIQLTTALLQLSQDGDLRRRLGQAAQEAAFTKHSWEHRAQEIEQIAFSL